MRAVVQRVSRASVTVEGAVVGEIGVGFLVLVAAHREDTPADAVKLAQKIRNLRVFNDEDGKMNRGLDEVDGAILAVSNFTLYGDAMGGRRPSFVLSAPFEEGRALFEAFLEALRATDIRVETGVFGAEMEVALVNAGPVTLILDTR